MKNRRAMCSCTKYFRGYMLSHITHIQYMLLYYISYFSMSLYFSVYI